LSCPPLIILFIGQWWTMCLWFDADPSGWSCTQFVLSFMLSSAWGAVQQGMCWHLNVLQHIAISINLQNIYLLLVDWWCLLLLLM
jgi:hypothetical protein